jgi:hypothetical protein
MNPIIGINVRIENIRKEPNGRKEKSAIVDLKSIGSFNVSGEEVKRGANEQLYLFRY